MKKIVFFTLMLCLISISCLTQNKTILEIDGNKISSDEFFYIYNKSAVNGAPTDYNSLREYLDLFINFKLKVHEAEVLGYDTLSTFKNELAGYRNQLAQPYLTDKKVEEDVLNEVYDRMKYDVRVAHILVKSSPIDAAEDTLKSFKKINMIYEKLANGESFEKLSSQYSDDEYFKNSGGDLGYYNVFSLVYEFETVMYETPVGEFSKPFKTNFGYHILKILDKRPTKGRYKVAHIMKVTPQDSRMEDNLAEDSIKIILNKIDNGADFEEMAKEFSDDRRTAVNGGQIGWLSVGGRMIREFEDAVFSLNKPGDIYRTLKTNYGYHIIKLLEIEELKPLDEIKIEIKDKVSNNARSSKSKEAVVKRLKNEYNLVKYPENVDVICKIFKDTSLFNNLENNSDLKLDAPIYRFADKTFTQRDIVENLINSNIVQSNINIDAFVDRSINSHIDNAIIEYENSILEAKYPDFKYIINEYHDGILLFEITDKVVWSKSISDKEGLNEFYENNKANYFWDNRIDYKLFHVKDLKTANKLSKMLLKGKDEDKIISRLNKKDSTAVSLKVSKRVEKDNLSNVDNVLIGKNVQTNIGGIYIDINPENNELTYIKNVGNVQKELKDARGVITADYQNKLEKDWIEKLHNEYSVIIFDDVLKSLVK